MNNKFFVVTCLLSFFVSGVANAQINPTPYNEMKWGESFEITGQNDNYVVDFDVVDEQTYNAATENKFVYSTQGSTTYYVYSYDKNDSKTFAPDRITTDQGGNDINQSFADLNITSTSAALGGAIYNKEGSSIGNINGDFINNSINQPTGSVPGSASGGAILNRSATIASITGDFIGNKSIVENDVLSPSYGGAVYNYSDASTSAIIGDITGDFIGNVTNAALGSAYGGAIANYQIPPSNSEIGDITGNFINNSAISGSSWSNGGAIFNNGTVGNVTGNFIGNSVETSNSIAFGGAINNDGNIGKIKGDFIQNTATSELYSRGGAIDNSNFIISVSGDFIENQAISSGSTGAVGGGFANYANDASLFAEVEAITGNFVSNSSISTGTGFAYGGAIYNYADIGGKVEVDLIDGNFYGNYTKSASATSGGGAIHNTIASSGTLIVSKIDSDFYQNYAESTSGSTFGGAIYNRNAEITEIVGSFYENYAKSQSGEAQGGAIYNVTNNSLNATIGNITGDFQGNYAQAGSFVQGGAIYNEGNAGAIASIGDIVGNFYNNYASSVSSGQTSAFGGAIYNAQYAKIGNITGDFVNNYASSESTTSDGKVTSYGGAIFNNAGTMADIVGNFSGNKTNVVSASTAFWADSVGGAVANTYGTINSIKGDFTNNQAISESTGLGAASYGGALYNIGGTINEISGDFINNASISTTGSASGGAIVNRAEIGTLTGNFIGNSAQAALGASGGAIRNMGEITITDSSFLDNYVEVVDASARGGAIYVEDENSVTNIIAENADVYFSGNYTSVSGVKDYNAISLNMPSGTTSGATIDLIAKTDKNIIFNDSIASSNIDNAVNIGDSADATTNGNVVFNDNISDVSLNINNGSVILGQDNYYTSKMCSGYGCRNTWSAKESTLENVNLSMLDNTNLYALNGVVQKFDINNMSLVGNIGYSFDVDLYNKTAETLNYATADFTNLVNFNIEDIKLVSDATAQSTVINFTKDADFASKISYSGPAQAWGNIYLYDVAYDYDAINGTSNLVFDRTDELNPVIHTSGVARDSLYANNNEMLRHILSNIGDNHLTSKYMASGDSYEFATFNNPWVKVYGSDEDVDLDGIIVKNKTYAGILGVDSTPVLLENGYVSAFSIYAAYLGSEQEFDGGKIDQNSAFLGARAMFEKGAFFNAFNANLGVSFAEANNMFGKEDFDMYSFGISSKTGYNIDLYCGNYILQPSLMLSYLYVNTPDYDNAGGVKVETGDLHSLNISPQLKLIAYLNNGLTAYTSAAYNWNVANDAEIKAQEVALPQLSVDPYAEFKIGTSGMITDVLTGFIEGFVTIGGRDGFGGQLGLKWNL